MPPDRTIAGDIPPVYGADTGHQIYLISQGIIHHSRMATSQLGRQRDVSHIPQRLAHTAELTEYGFLRWLCFV